MKHVFWGFFFLFLNFNLTVNGHTLNVLPPFVGCWLLYRGFGEMTAQCGRFDALRPFAMGLGIYTALIWVGDLLGMGSASWISSLLGLAATIVELYIAWGVIQCLREVEARWQADCNTPAMHKAWMVLLITQIAIFVIRILGSFAWSLAAFLGIVCVVMELVGIVLFLMAVWRAGKCCGALPTPQTEF